MIFFLVQQYHEYTVENFLQTWARPLAGKVAVLNWQEALGLGRLHRGTYVLCDYERLTPAQWEFARIVHDALAADGCRVLNRPDRVADRASLLRRLRAEGNNRFDAYRPGIDDLSGVRFPCFVRRISAHTGEMSGLLHDRASLDGEVARQRAAGHHDLLVIEYVDTASHDPSDHGGGIFRKYGLFRFGEAMCPRHLYVSRDWLVSKPAVTDDWAVAEEAAFIDRNAHAEPMRAVFELGGIDYGRADYSMLDGRPQVWEINTNPMLLAAPHRIHPPRLPAQARGAAATADAILSLDDGTAYEPSRAANWVHFEVPPGLRDRLGGHRSDAALRVLGRAMLQISRTPVVRRVVQVCQRAQRLAGNELAAPSRRAA